MEVSQVLEGLNEWALRHRQMAYTVAAASCTRDLTMTWRDRWC